MSTWRIISGLRKQAGEGNGLPRLWFVAGLGERLATSGLKMTRALFGACSEEFLAMNESLTGQEIRREEVILM